MANQRAQGSFFIIQPLLNRSDTKGSPHNHRAKALAFRGFGAPGKLSGGQFSAENGPAGPGIGGRSLPTSFLQNVLTLHCLPLCKM